LPGHVKALRYYNVIKVSKASEGTT